MLLGLASQEPAWGAERASTALLPMSALWARVPSRISLQQRAPRSIQLLFLLSSPLENTSYDLAAWASVRSRMAYVLDAVCVTNFMQNRLFYKLNFGFV